jgi:hypothetical protein
MPWHNTYNNNYDDNIKTAEEFSAYILFVQQLLFIHVKATQVAGGKSLCNTWKTECRSL